MIGVFGAGFHIVFAALLWVQTVRVRLVFTKDYMEFYNVKGKGCDLENGAKLVNLKGVVKTKMLPDKYLGKQLSKSCRLCS